MAFVNAYLTEKEKEEFEKADIRDPRYPFSNDRRLTPTYWTVDRKNNIALIYGGVADREEHNKETFVLVYKKICSENIIIMTLINGYINYEEREKLEKKYNVNLYKIWKLHELQIPQQLRQSIQIEQLYKIIEDALSVYGVNGNPDHPTSVKAVLGWSRPYT